ncbi:MAG: sigma-54 dependent transcriptional regulator [Gammaproteobacteria bacterium]|nr:sigma-54 dependent transcriptional regulator [Gammaproteobacteria bacterium]MBU1653296.1 sigma-54 dependent transcriptional regulator [Gammaproteobacteria bacterium]MBU1962436.1 sigma-54 dependent transcriptional regulator [Gammaproteobacteria bacterium]
MSTRILIVEDEAVIRAALRQLLERHGYSVEEAASTEEAESRPDLRQFHLLLVDIRLPGKPGTDLLRQVRDIPILIMTSYASVRSAVDAMKEGAADYIAKPFDHGELLMVVERILRQRRSERSLEALRSDLRRTYPVEGMVGDCPAMQKVFQQLEKVAPTDATVLILGQSGTGKELLARALHEKSRRCEAPFVAFNCAAVPDQLIEAELFGHGQDSPPGLIGQAEGGTLFLDEVGELPPAAQARLLRLLQADNLAGPERTSGGRADIRIVAATHRDLRKLVQEHAFRSDLYFRLRVVEMQLPPLRERGDDRVELAVFLLRKICTQLNKPHLLLHRDCLEQIRRYPWPGNVRELANALERAAILCDCDLITPDLLGIDHRIHAQSENGSELAEKLSLEEYFRHFVIENQERLTETELAKRLGISRKALWERRQRFGIPRAKKPAS